MIKNLYIIDQSGICVYNIDFLSPIGESKTNQKDLQLVSGFFIAIDSFANIAYNDNSLQSLKLQNMNFYFAKSNEYIAVLTTDGVGQKFTEEDYTEILIIVLKEFQELLKEKNLKSPLMEEISDIELERKIRDVISTILRRALFR